MGSGVTIAFNFFFLYDTYTINVIIFNISMYICTCVYTDIRIYIGMHVIILKLSLSSPSAETWFVQDLW